ncbi:hypothetical protein SOM61_26380 [Massilia sp. CFBP9012]|uniref:WapI family immunity protein n=1 Tax=Massilia sp. CFBP9012 TaxID=3096531 RepID=UPI002A6A5BF8|nr:hypothetical protein [Massilia sp. CFBP9012]MDY0978493.1 hypothetical protein [Massilia sp. CFBP9012]
MRCIQRSISSANGGEVNRHLNELGEPHLHLAGLKLWVHGYRYRDVDDYWDGNWLNATAVCSENGATVLVRGAFIRTDEIQDWQHALDKLLADLQGEATLECMEPEIAVTLRAKSLGAIEMEVRITPDQSTQEHRFIFAIDQSYLEPISSQCARLLTAFPIRGS